MIPLKSFCVGLFFLGIISEISSDYLHFGGTEEESRQATYYLSADSGANTGPTDELKRTQRSFWKKLFKNGLFGECDNCCNNCNYNVGNGDNYSPVPSRLLPFQPWRPLPLWRPLQPLFGTINYDNYGTNSYAEGNSNNYGNPPSYGMNTYGSSGVNTPTTYDNNASPAQEPVYEIPTELPPAEPDYKIDNTPVGEDTCEPPSKPVLTEKSYNIPEPSTYRNDEKPKTAQQYSNEKVPQIIYQPIIYVSPQYQGNGALNKVKEEETKYIEEHEENDKAKLSSYETESDIESKQSPYVSDADYVKSNEASNSVDNSPENQISDIKVPYSKSYTTPHNQQPIPCLSHLPTNPSVSTVSTVYNIISPSILHTLTAGQNPYNADVIASTIPCANSGTSKYSLYPSNVVPLESYSLPAPTTKPVLAPQQISNLTPVSSPTFVPSTQTYEQPIHLTTDDQPYRVCPELFEEYQRKLNMILPHIHGRSTFVNAQLIHY